MEVERLEEEIRQLKTKLDVLQKRLKDIQQTCNHQYLEKNTYYQQCTECHKVNILHY